MLSPSDFNNAVPQFTNGNYASNPINPQYIAEPDATSYNRGAEPLQTLPAQWWNWFLNKFTGRFNKVNVYVKNIFNELAQLLSLVNITPDGTEATPTTGQLKSAFQTEYPKYLALLMYPVGSIYWTGKAPDDGGDPNVLFGGTWVQIKGKFVWAKGDSDTLNATGGEKTHTLTTSEIPSHNHSFTPAGTVSGHTHSMNDHTHSFTPSGTVASHTHSVGAHSHGLNSHTHSFTPSGTVQKHSHGLNSHTHSFTPSGTVGSGGSHYHFVWSTNDVNENASPVSTKVVNTVQNVNYNTADAYSSSSRFPVPYPYTSDNGAMVRQFLDGEGNGSNVAVGHGAKYGSDGANKVSSWSGYHNHSFTGTAGTTGGASGNTTEVQPSFTGTAGTTGKATGSTANSTAFNSGSTQPTFTGTAGTTGKATGNTGSATPTFTGTAGTTGSKGDGGAHNNMPPYVVKYCWERTA